MDIDLSSDLQHIPKLLGAIRGGSHIAQGSRLMRGARVIGRPLVREITSRCYIGLLKLVTGSHLSDFQCGFKAINKATAMELLPFIEDTSWFFDSELLILAEKLGLSIYEEPITWRDDPGSTVNILSTAIDDLHGLRRVMYKKSWRSHQTNLL